MLNDHDKFIDEVIKKVTTQKNKGQTKSLREQKEKVTVESLMEVTGLPEHEIIQIMEATRKEQKEEETRTEQKEEERTQYSSIQATPSPQKVEKSSDDVFWSLFKWYKIILISSVPFMALYLFMPYFSY